MALQAATLERGPATKLASKRFTAVEFFAGVGLARAGLEAGGFEVLWANDIAASKQKLYAARFPGVSHYQLCDVFEVAGGQLPAADLAWASSPCTNLSLAGGREGLSGEESNAFFGFTKAISEMEIPPRILVLENVVGLATSNGGADLEAVIKEFNSLGYTCDVLLLDARYWLPQSRPRLFVIGMRNPAAIPQMTASSRLRPPVVQGPFKNRALDTIKMDVPEPPLPVAGGFSLLVRSQPCRVFNWWDQERTQSFLQSLSPIQKDRVTALIGGNEIVHRTAYRRTRNGQAVWEVRPDDISGCLRTPRGGSSKQAVVQMGLGDIKVRWMTGWEYAALMGADSYPLAGFTDSEIQFAFGDAVAVPLVTWLAKNYFEPYLHNDVRVDDV